MPKKFNKKITSTVPETSSEDDGMETECFSTSSDSDYLPDLNIGIPIPSKLNFSIYNLF